MYCYSAAPRFEEIKSIDVSLQNGQMPGMSGKHLLEKDLPTLAHYGVKPL